jgi:hypothetical protein
MVDRGLTHPRLAVATRRRTPRSPLPVLNQHGLRTITTSGLVATVPDEHASPRPTI